MINFFEVLIGASEASVNCFQSENAHKNSPVIARNEAI